MLSHPSLTFADSFLVSSFRYACAAALASYTFFCVQTAADDRTLPCKAVLLPSSISSVKSFAKQLLEDDSRVAAEGKECGAHG